MTRYRPVDIPRTPAATAPENSSAPRLVFTPLHGVAAARLGHALPSYILPLGGAPKSSCPPRAARQEG